jgi:hypothetical protein
MSEAYGSATFAVLSSFRISVFVPPNGILLDVLLLEVALLEDLL